MKKKKQLISEIVDSSNTHNIEIFKNIIDKGCKCLIIDSYYHNLNFKEEFNSFLEVYKNKLEFVILVDSSEMTYYKIANFYKRQINPIVVAITGSVGKTSVSEMLYFILSKEYKVHKSNVANTFMAITRSIIKMPLNTEYFIVEVSSRRSGLMEVNSQIIEPDISIITQIQPEHLKGMGSLDGIAKEKLSLIKYMKDNGLLICPNIKYIKKNLDINFNGEIILVNQKNITDLILNNLNSNFKYKNEKYIINEPGKHLIENSLLVIEACSYLNINKQNIKEGLFQYKNIGNRWNIKYSKNNNVVINDSPNNPSPATVKSSIETLFSSFPNHKKIVILSDILELGTFENQLYEDLAKYINNFDIDELILYGENIKIMEKLIDNKNIHIKVFNRNMSKPIKFYFNGQLTNYVGSCIFENTAILIKASRVMGFDKVSKNIIRYIDENL